MTVTTQRETLAESAGDVLAALAATPTGNPRRRALRDQAIEA